MDTAPPTGPCEAFSTDGDLANTLSRAVERSSPPCAPPPTRLGRARLRYGFRLILALSAYAALPTAAVLLAHAGWTWSSVGLVWLNLLGLVALLLVFATFPLPVRPGIQRRNDFSAVVWLPHVAVTRLSERGIQGRAGGRRWGRIGLAMALLCGSPLLVVIELIGHSDSAGFAVWIASFGASSAVFLTLAYIGRELRSEAGELARGADIG